MKDFIRNCVKTVIERDSNEIRSEDLTVEFGYDCIGIRINKEGIDLSSDIIDELKDKLGTDLCWIRITESGRVMLCFDIQNTILQHYGDWESYNKIYDNQ